MDPIPSGDSYLSKNGMDYAEALCTVVHRKKRFKSFPSPIPAQGEFGSDIPAGDGKLANLFFTVYAPRKSHRNKITL
jgi:hypothetical protein